MIFRLIVMGLMWSGTIAWAAPTPVWTTAWGRTVGGQHAVVAGRGDSAGSWTFLAYESSYTSMLLTVSSSGVVTGVVVLPMEPGTWPSDVEPDGAGGWYLALNSYGAPLVTPIIQRRDSNGVVLWSTSWTAAAGTTATRLRLDGAGGVVAVADLYYSSGACLACRQAYVGRWNGAGSQAWTRTVDASSLGAWTYTQDVIVDPGVAVYVVGVAAETGGYPPYAARFDLAGNRQWLQRYAYSGADARGVTGALAPSGDLYLAGAGWFADAWIRRIDPGSGAQTAATTVSNVMNGQLTVDTGGDLYLAGIDFSAYPVMPFMCFKFDAALTPAPGWPVTVPGPQVEYNSWFGSWQKPLFVQRDGAGAVRLAGDTYGSCGDIGDLLLGQLTTAGGLVGTTVPGVPASDTVVDLTTGPGANAAVLAVCDDRKYVVALDAAGNQQWSTPMPQTLLCRTEPRGGIARASDGSYAVSYEESDWSTGASWVSVTRLDATGGVLWTRTRGGDQALGEWESGGPCAIAPAGGVVVAAGRSGALDLVRCDATGNCTGSTFNDPAGLDWSDSGPGTAIDVDLSGTAYVLGTGYDSGPPFQAGFRVARIGPAYELEGVAQFFCSNNGYAGGGGIRVIAGGYVFNGWDAEPPSYDRRGWTVKMTDTGQVVWARSFTGSKAVQFRGVDVDAAGNVYSSGAIGDVYTGASDGILVSYDPAGNLRWIETYDSGETMEEFARVRAPGGILVAGTMRNDAWVRLYDDTIVVPVPVPPSPPGPGPIGVAPNPVAGDSVEVRLDLTGAADFVAIELFDAALARVYRGTWNGVPGGTRFFTIRGLANLAPGNYVLRASAQLTAGGTQSFPTQGVQIQ